MCRAEAVYDSSVKSPLIGGVKRRVLTVLSYARWKRRIGVGVLSAVAFASSNTGAQSATNRFERIPGGVAVVSGDSAPHRFAVTLCSDNIAHVTYAPASLGKIAATPLLAEGACSDTARNIRVVESQDTITLVTPRMRVLLQRTWPYLRVYDAAGQLLMRDRQRRLVGGHAYTMFGQDHDASIYGLGQHQSGVLDLSGQYVPLTPQNTNISVPFLVSSSGFGLLWNTAGAAVMNNRDRGNVIFTADSVPAIDYFVVVGPSIDTVIAGYRALTGHAPMLPKWAYGLWQSKNRYSTQRELLSVAAKYRAKGLPLDVIVQDFFWWKVMGGHEFDPVRYPTPRAMFDSLHRMDVHGVLSVWPRFFPGTANVEYMRQRNYLVKGADAYDPTHPEARRAYWTMLDTALLAKGVDGWWLDATEPETDWNDNDNVLGDVTRGMQQLYGGSGVQFANAYSLLTTSVIYEGQRERDSTRRVVILTRSGTAGQQRNSAISWSGDVTTDWNAFRRQIPAGLDFALAGIPYWTTDIGGFGQNPPWGDNQSPAYRELFVRWFQYGTFCPIFRIHGTRHNSRLKHDSDEGDSLSARVGNELWSYGPEVERIVARYDSLRYQLMPYVYSLAWKTTSEGYTPMRALIMDFPGDARVRRIGDEFMYGPALLVAPVTDSGARSRSVYVPAGGWFDFWTGAEVRGGRWFMAAAPLERMPLFVRAGSIVPMGRAVQHASESWDPIEVRVYPGADAAFTLYDDAGDGYGYERGEHATIALGWDDRAKALRIGERRGAYPGMPATRSFRVVKVGGAGVGAGKAVHYDGKGVTVWMP
jgi:alpha-D-xyloside xylohydrolase